MLVNIKKYLISWFVLSMVVVWFLFMKSLSNNFYQNESKDNQQNNQKQLVRKVIQQKVYNFVINHKNNSYFVQCFNNSIRQNDKIILDGQKKFWDNILYLQSVNWLFDENELLTHSNNKSNEYKLYRLDLVDCSTVSCVEDKYKANSLLIESSYIWDKYNYSSDNIKQRKEAEKKALEEAVKDRIKEIELANQNQKEFETYKWFLENCYLWKISWDVIVTNKVLADRFLKFRKDIGYSIANKEIYDMLLEYSSISLDKVWKIKKRYIEDY